ncbi:hypothetical protein AAEX28_13970 [Lentisphaerota bacterium WC36G]|nr:hypothetical protein LJT99_00720 [Lentisphaerae bacterium WC36]
MKYKIVSLISVIIITVLLAVLVKLQDNTKINITNLELTNTKINDDLLKKIINVLKLKSDIEAKKLLISDKSIVHHIKDTEKFKLVSLNSGFKLLQEKSKSSEVKALAVLFQSLIDFELENYQKAIEKYKSVEPITHSSNKISKDDKNLLLWRMNNEINYLKQTKITDDSKININGIVLNNSDFFKSIFKPFKIVFSGKIQVNFEINPKLQIEDILFSLSAKGKNNNQNPEMILQNSQTIIKRKNNSFYISNLAPETYDFSINAKIKEVKNKKIDYAVRSVKKWDLTTFGQKYSPKNQNIYHSLYRKYYSKPITIAPNGNIVLNEEINHIEIDFPKNISLKKDKQIIKWQYYLLDRYKNVIIKTYIIPTKAKKMYEVMNNNNAVIIDKKFLTKKCQLNFGDEANFMLKIIDQKTNKLIAINSRFFTCKP